ncbi:MAG: hypothetical protein QOD99_3096 [Chthoniobacter sp.]|jgi:hypothetical protein|nr:hypothetical protein [Chthoniobacter sp.]
MKIVLADSTLASYGQGGGHWMVYLQYLLGLSDLGHDVFLWEQMRSSGDADEDTARVRLFFARLEEFGFKTRSGLVVLPKEAPDDVSLDAGVSYGKSDIEMRQIARDADILWNLCGALRQPILSLFKRRAFIDLDPGHLQVSALTCEMGLGEHQLFFSVGSKIRDADCEVPTLGFDWQPFFPFVFLPMWCAQPDPGFESPFTSITHWNWGDLWYQDRLVSVSKRESYLRYRELPHRSGRHFRLAANLHPQDQTGDRELLQSSGWELAHPYDVADSPSAYQRFIADSRAEICCVKPVFRELKTGWLSDRSACYLASGRPVMMEDTGVSECLPGGAGLLFFRDTEEALAAVSEIDGNYACHSRVARELAEHFLDSRKTLSAMLAVC